MKETSKLQVDEGKMVVTISPNAGEKPKKGADQASQLADMEDALKLATEEAHKKRVALGGNLSQS